MLRLITLAATSGLLLAGPTAAQVTPAPTPGGGTAYGAGVPPFPSQNDGRLLLREGEFLMSNGSTARVQVLSNSPVPNPGDVPGAGMASGAGNAPAGWDSAYPAGSQPLASQTDGVLLVRELTVFDPRTGASATSRILSNTPVPNPESVRARRARR